MKPTITQPSNPQSVDRKVLLLLRRKGAQTIESLSVLTGIGWGSVYKSVDRLSRSGKVSLTSVYPNEYRVSVSTGPFTGIILPQPRPAEATFAQLSRADLLYA